MRAQIIEALFQRMATKPDLFFLTADMGINLVEKFAEKYPERYLNVGIAEQNMVGVAAGLVNMGYRPFAYTISNFAVHRCFEQIRNDIGIHEYPVTLLGTSTGYDNAPLGPTHHIIDDWSALRSIPGIDIYCPSSIHYAQGLLDTVIAAKRPAYIRIPKGDFVAPNSTAHVVSLPGEDKGTVLVSYGTLAQACLGVQKERPSISVVVINRLRPLDEEVLLDALTPHKRIVVVEDQFPQTGLYGMLCELTVRRGLRMPIQPLAPAHYNLEVGSSDGFFHRLVGIDRDSILRAVG